MEEIYNKLVRDKIIEKIINNNEKPIYSTLNDDDFKNELEKKLLEEYKEVLNANSKEERLEELADMLEIINYLAMIDGYSLEDIIDTSIIKKEKRGGFDKKLFLEKVITKDDHIL
ncbi:MAG: nucleoside triphosphate pyrophosphohydrolase [Bacilli bacterium]|nr:nucleoside triphosphate pyrophosphohydrolase [Bacilli bacterium]